MSALLPSFRERTSKLPIKIPQTVANSQECPFGTHHFLTPSRRRVAVFLWRQPALCHKGDTLDTRSEFAHGTPLCGGCPSFHLTDGGAGLQTGYVTQSRASKGQNWSMYLSFLVEPENG